MIHFVLNDLRRPAGVGFETDFKTIVLITNLDFPVTNGSAGSGQGQASLFCFVAVLFSDDFRVKHQLGSMLTGKYNDPFCLSDHICRHAHALRRVGI